MRLQFILGKQGNERIEIQPIMQYNLEITDQNPDIQIIHNRLLPKTITKPTVIIERADSANLFHTREIIERREIIGILKISKLRFPQLENETTCNGRYFCKLINKSANLFKEKIPTEIKSFNKIKCLIPSSIQERFRIYKDLSIDFNALRKINIHFIGRTNYGNLSLVNWHRAKAEKAIRKFPESCVHTTVFANHRPITDEQYLEIMLNSKICLSPWGMGEWNYRDFQALYAGCILIKPNSDHVEMYPIDIFRDLFYVRCQPDFNDLEEKYHSIMNNWHNYKEIRENNRYSLVNSWNYKKLSKEFTERMEELYDNSKCS